ncbi:secretory phospholipase A2 receptor-like [Sebastes fasciatus]|uniref:secretory phospholipase A2 receptor-like n=1 Tax=Sebastes fasciatus TaxID=394691 RepID=UPI003D9F1369
MANPDDMDKMEMVLKALGDQYYDAAWIGLRKGGTERWHWSLSDRALYTGRERNYRIWGSSSNSDPCGVIKSGKLSTHLCGIFRNSICFDGSKQGRDQYILITNATIWPVARDYCRAHYTDLTSARNIPEYNTLHDVAGDQEVWVGLFKDKWEWLDKSDSSFRYWNLDHEIHAPTSQVCGALFKSHSGGWGERPCGEPNQSVCKCPVVSIIKVRISSQDSVLEQNDPAMQDDILKQIMAELGKKNVLGVSKLRWKKHPDGRVFNKEPQRSG